MPSFRPSLRSIVASAAVLVFALVAALPAVAGYRYTAVTTVTSDQGDSRTEVEAWIDGDKAKVVFTDASGQPLFEEGTYMVTTDAGRTLFLVDPEEKTYSRLDLAAMMQSLNAMVESTGGLVDLEFEDPEVEKLGQEPGEELLGYPTTKTRFRTAFDMTLKVMGMKNRNRSESVTEVWTTDALDDPAFGVWLRKEPVETGDADFDDVIAASLSTVEGFPLKTVSDTTTIGGRRGQRRTESRSETVVTALEETSVPASTFEIPDGYEETELMDEEESNPLSGIFGRGRGDG
jgi:hypothetical protein